jgi:tRNA G18 (ribose-2'-O)-methylase SpoU
MTSAGKQLDGQVLYERQKASLAAKAHVPGPTIIAFNLQVNENMGGVLRLADAAGCRQVVFVGSPAFDISRIHKAARNSEALVKWTATSHEDFLAHIADYKPLIALEITTASTPIFEAQLPSACAIVIGGERHGVPADVLAACDFAVHIPMFGVNGSMNVTHALAVALFEWRRQHVHQASPA